MPNVSTPLSNNRTKVHQPTLLTPLLDPAIGQFIHDHSQRLIELVSQHGSPLNLMWPHAFKANTAALQSVLKKYDVNHLIFYGAKANKSQCLLRAAEDLGIGVDVSSIHELNAARRAGTAGALLCATGPAKTTVFHRALVEAGSLICVDSLEEFAHLKTLVKTTRPPLQARVLLRYRPQSCLASRFGMGTHDLLECLRQLTEEGEYFHFEGFHFHLGGYGYETRVQAFREVTAFVEAAHEMGLNPSMIDMGGGLPIRYVDPEIYNSFLRNNNKPGHYYNHSVPESFYPYGGTLTASQWLELFLESDHSSDHSIANYLKSRNITLSLQPGRSLVDQAALSVFRVTRTKKLADNKTVIFVEGSSFSACETWFASEYLVDPILISASQSPHNPTQAYIAGHSCLDDDVISYRLINFEYLPQPGDLLIYANTAGYQMDLLENEFHRHPLPRRLMATCCTQGHYAFSPDC
ncbi:MULTISPECIES: Y4yA family PLP-dependent enzyme [Pseudomonas]|uniref:Y4yA family PLP-dependent enzyme n=1 Tax=Pseudomonas TaxID=286 RepID=UPI0009086105|nr:MULTISPECIES: Y4yA family PLP-dependent enzyme [Pseudomonas]TCV66002.1 diaminopimelate decarboxylase [Pseudomonas fluorescens]SFW20677.1 diaminopimelate decarboxylase [Pseudomonas sp. NFACC04-2]